jgi:hypothetical protein
MLLCLLTIVSILPFGIYRLTAGQLVAAASTWRWCWPCWR